MPASYSLTGRLGELIVRGGKLSADVAERVVSASLSLSSYEVSQLTIDLVESPNFELLRSGLFSPGTPTKAGSRCDYGKLALEVRAIDLVERGTDHVLVVTARSYGAGRLRRARGPLVRRGLSPTQFAKLEAREAGLKFLGQPSAARKNITRLSGKGDNESSWDTIQRLAAELGFVCFEAAGVLHFGKPTWITAHADEVAVKWSGVKTPDTLDSLPRCRRSGDNKRAAADVEVLLRGKPGDTTRPGMALVLDGVPTFDGRYMVDTVDLPLAENAAATVKAITPINPEPQPPAPRVKTSPGPGATSSTSSTGATGAKSAAAFVAIALEQAGDSYIYGAEAAATDPDPNAFDCSELVEWAAARVGVPFVDGSAAQIAAAKPITVAQAIATRGALLYTTTPSSHIAISLGNGKTIEAANSRVGVVSYSAAGRFQRGGLIPGMRY